MTKARYAICFAPEHGSALEALAYEWFGKNGEGHSGPSSLVPGMSVSRLLELTRGPRGHGMHGTLKPSFELYPHTTEDGLLTVANLVAKSLAPVELPPLELGEIADIVSLVLEASSATLENLAAVCVRAFDGYRRPLTTDEEDLYKQRRLTVHQEQMLDHWGYPYVMEEFDFHISLTDSIPDSKERGQVMAVLARLAQSVLHKPLVMRELAVFKQVGAETSMSIIARIPFGRRA